MDASITDEAKAKRIAWWKAASREKRASVAAECGTTARYIGVLVYGHRRPQFELAQRLAAASGLARKWWLPEAWG